MTNVDEVICIFCSRNKGNIKFGDLYARFDQDG